MITAVLPSYASQLDRTAAWDVNVHRNAILECSCLEEPEFIARDVNILSCDRHVEDYLSLLDHSLIHLPHITQREKVKNVWKTGSEAVRKFKQSQPPSVRNENRELCHVLKEELSSTADEATAIVAATQIKHSCHEHPRDYYMCFRHAYIQGRNAPGLEENPITFTHVYALTLQLGSFKNTSH